MVVKSVFIINSQSIAVGKKKGGYCLCVIEIRGLIDFEFIHTFQCSIGELLAFTQTENLYIFGGLLGVEMTDHHFKQIITIKTENPINFFVTINQNTLLLGSIQGVMDIVDVKKLKKINSQKIEYETNVTIVKKLQQNMLVVGTFGGLKLAKYYNNHH